MVEGEPRGRLGKFPTRELHAKPLHRVQPFVVFVGLFLVDRNGGMRRQALDLERLAKALGVLRRKAFKSLQA